MSEGESIEVTSAAAAMIVAILAKLPKQDQVITLVMAMSALEVDVYIREILLKLQVDEEGRQFQRNYARDIQKILAEKLWQTTPSTKSELQYSNSTREWPVAKRNEWQPWKVSNKQF